MSRCYAPPVTPNNAKDTGERERITAEGLRIIRETESWQCMRKTKTVTSLDMTELDSVIDFVLLIRFNISESDSITYQMLVCV